MDTIEADSFWCMSKLLDGIQVNLILYILEKPFTLKEALEISPKQIEEIQRQSQIITGERLPLWSHSLTTKIILLIFTTANDSSNLAHRLLIAFSDLEKPKYKKNFKKTNAGACANIAQKPYRASLNVFISSFFAVPFLILFFACLRDIGLRETIRSNLLSSVNFFVLD